jgi:ATP citrate (pro-S)-lyase
MSAPATATTRFFRITLRRSAIGLPHTIRGTLLALGIHKRGQTVYQPVNCTSAGQIFQVKELVKVEEVDEKKTKREIWLERRPDPGYWVESAVPR